jgi:hypothetical protein
LIENIERGSRKRPNPDCNTESVLDRIWGDDPAYATIMEYASRYLCQDGDHIRCIKRDKDKHVYLLDSTSRKCLNKMGEHGTSTIYYLLYPDGVCVKCRSKKPVYYLNGAAVSPQLNPDLFAPNRFDLPMKCCDFKSTMVPYATDWRDRMRELFSKHYASQFPKGPTMRRMDSAMRLAPASASAYGASTAIGTTPPPRSVLDDASQIDMDLDSMFSTSNISLLDYVPEIRDAPSFSAALKKDKQLKMMMGQM